MHKLVAEYDLGLRVSFWVA